MMLGFQRNEGVKTALGIGEFDPLFKELKDALNRYFLGEGRWSSQYGDIRSYKIAWRHKIDRGGGNCHAIAGAIDRGNLNTPMDRGVVMMARRYLKDVFKINGCKMIAIETHPISKRKIWEKYDFDPDSSKSKELIVVKYSKKS